MTDKTARRAPGMTFNDILKLLGSRIRKLRKGRGWSQEEFALACGIHRSHMGEIERGESNFTLSTLLAIMQTLGATLPRIFRGIE